MGGERWERVKELFEAARERDEPERAPFLDQACAHDPELRREVESLLSGDKNAGSFLQEPVAHVSPAAFANDQPPSTFSPDEIISGRFEIMRFIGRGGMGEVYEARDLKLRERVALKTIRPEIASDPRTLERFRREITTARRVTHPNVCRMYDLEEQQQPEGSGRPPISFLTMELLEGETLADLIYTNRVSSARGPCLRREPFACGPAQIGRTCWDASRARGPQPPLARRRRPARGRSRPRAARWRRSAGPCS